MRISILLYAFWTCFVGFSQTFEADMKLVVEAIQNAETCRLSSNIIVYNSKKEKVEIVRYSSDLRKSGEYYRTKIADSEVICNSKFFITIDHQEKIISRQRVEKLSADDKSFLDEIYKMQSSDSEKIKITFQESQGSINSYLLEYDSGEINSARIYIDTDKKSLVKICYEYNLAYYPDNNYVEVLYDSFELNLQIDDKIFQGKDIFIESGNTINMNKNYHNYQFVDYANE